MPVTIPANVGSVLYVQMRMIACTAYLAGYDLKSDQVQTLTIEKIPGKALTKINQKIGFRFITKFGQKGVLNLGKTVPVVRSIIGGGGDCVETKIIANRAYKMFFENDFSVEEQKEVKDNE